MKSNYINTIDLNEDQFLGDVLDELPNGIIDKTYTANGGTTVELNANRDSIIVAPLKSIANCKKEKFPHIIVVNGDIDVYRIEKQIEKLRKKGQFVKLFTTPESIWKVKKALDAANEKFNNYFYLIDEIHMYQTESGYRNEMGRAIEEYFNHTSGNRAIMTATRYEFSDRRFHKEPITKIEPNRGKNEILIYKTHNINEAIKTLWDGEKFIFVNSIIMAKEIEKSLGIDSNIYCSDAKRSRRLADKSFRRFDEPLAGINLFTSAYFTGYDIEAHGDIIIVVNAYLEHTMLNLLTLYQVTGRLRGGVGRIKMLVVFNNKLKGNNTTEELLKEDLHENAAHQESVWNVGLKHGMTNDNNIKYMEMFFENSKPFNERLIRKQNDSYKAEIDFCAIDGQIIKWETKILYSNINLLLKGINSTDQMTAKYEGFIETPGISDELRSEIREFEKLSNLESFNKIIEISERKDMDIFRKILLDKTLDNFAQSNDNYEVLAAQFIELLGIEVFKKAGRDIKKLRNGIKKAIISKLAKEGNVECKVKEAFADESWVSSIDIKTNLQEIFDECNINTTAKGSTIKWYYHVHESVKTINGKNIRGYEILGSI